MVQAHPPSTQFQGLCIQPYRPRMIARLILNAREADKRARDAPRVLRATGQSETLLKQRSRAPEIPLAAHPVCQGAEAPDDVERGAKLAGQVEGPLLQAHRAFVVSPLVGHKPELADRKSTRLNSSHANISYAVFCLK